MIFTVALSSCKKNSETTTGTTTETQKVVDEFDFIRNLVSAYAFSEENMKLDVWNSTESLQNLNDIDDSEEFVVFATKTAYCLRIIKQRRRGFLYFYNRGRLVDFGFP